MKKFYSFALAAVAAFSASAQDVISTSIKPRTFQKSIELKSDISVKDDASYTVEDVVGSYYGSATSYINGGTDMANQEITVTFDESDNTLNFVGFYSTYALKAYFDEDDATITFPNMQFILHNTKYDEDVYYNSRQWNAAGNGILNTGAEVVATFDGTNIVFSEDDLMAIEIPGLGYFALWGDIVVSGEKPEEDFTDHYADIDWQEAGQALFTPGWISGNFSSITEWNNYSYNVPVQKHPTREIYRLVNPFNQVTCPFTNAYLNAGYTFKDGYIMFDLQDEENPFVYSEIFSGMIDDEGEGWYFYDILGYYGMDMLDAIKAQLPQYLSTYDENVLTVNLPLFGYGAVNMNAAQNWKTVVPAVINMTEMAGVDGIIAEDTEAPVEYYNLQGVRVAEPTTGLYIVRQGAKATKKLVK